MATLADESVFDRAHGFGRPSHAKYPWDQWMDGRVWKLTHGEDFDPPVERFRQQVINRGLKTGRKVRTRAEDGRILYIQAVFPEPD